MRKLPAMAGIELANWTLRQAQEEGGPSVCLGAIQHQREPQRLPELSASVEVRPEASQEAAAEAAEEKREAFVVAYATLREEAVRSGAKIFFTDKAHFRADAELRGRWVLRGEPAPRFH